MSSPEYGTLPSYSKKISEYSGCVSLADNLRRIFKWYRQKLDHSRDCRRVSQRVSCETAEATSVLLFMIEYERVAMSLFGLVVLYTLSGLAKAASYFDVGPRWLRQFKIGKSTVY
jgi:hypothetical protein